MQSLDLTKSEWDKIYGKGKPMAGLSQAALRKKEEHRWSYMTTDALYKRLQRITVPEKLNMFREFAIMNGNDYLINAADAHHKRLLARMGIPVDGVIASNGVVLPVSNKSGVTKPVQADERYLDI